VVGVTLLPLGVVDVMLIAMAANAATCVGSWAVLAFQLRREGVRLSWARATMRATRQMMGFGAFMSLNSLAGIAMRQIMQLVLANALSAAALAAWATSVQVVSRVNALMGSVFEGLMPAAAAVRKGDMESIQGLRRAYHRAVRLSLAGSCALSALIFVVSPWVVPLWLRSSLSGDVVTLIRISCVGLAINGATPAAYHLINGVGRPHLNTAFILANPLIFYATLALLSTNGLVLFDFAVAGAVSLLLSGIGYLLFAEVYLWPSVIAGHLPAPTRPGQEG